VDLRNWRYEGEGKEKEERKNSGCASPGGRTKRKGFHYFLTGGGAHFSRACTQKNHENTSKKEEKRGIGKGGKKKKTGTVLLVPGGNFMIRHQKNPHWPGKRVLYNVQKQWNLRRDPSQERGKNSQLRGEGGENRTTSRSSNE